MIPKIVSKWFTSRQCNRCTELEAGLTRLKSIDFSQDTDYLSLDAAFDGAAIKLFAASAVHWFKTCGGKNFVTLELDDPKTGESYEITMKHKAGITPGQRIRELEQSLSEYKARFDWYFGKTDTTAWLDTYIGGVGQQWGPDRWAHEIDRAMALQNRHTEDNL